MNSVIQQITEWLKSVLVSGIMDNLTGTFASVNDQVGEIAVEVGQTPGNFMPAVFNMVRNLSESVIMPIAGILLTFIACYELIQLIISYNNLANFETWFIWKWIFKTCVAECGAAGRRHYTGKYSDRCRYPDHNAEYLGSNGIGKSDCSLSSILYRTVSYVCFGSNYFRYYQWPDGGNLSDGQPGTDPVRNIWKQGSEYDGSKLFAELVCIGISGISHHGLCGNICRPDSVSRI